MSEILKRLDRKLVQHGHIIDIYEDTIQLPDGRTAAWDFISHNGAAAVVPVTERGTLLMVKQYRNALDRYTLEVPAGALDSTEESGIDCAARELEEETGFRSEKLEWMLTIRTTVAFCNEKIEIFVAKDLIPSQQNLDEDEYVDVEEHTLEDLCEMIYSGKIEDSKTICAIMTYKSKYCSCK